MVQTNEPAVIQGVSSNIPPESLSVKSEPTEQLIRGNYTVPNGYELHISSIQCVCMMDVGWSLSLASPRLSITIKDGRTLTWLEGDFQDSVERSINLDLSAAPLIMDSGQSISLQIATHLTPDLTINALLIEK